MRIDEVTGRDILPRKIITHFRIYPNGMEKVDAPVWMNPSPRDLKLLAQNSMNVRFNRGDDVGGDPWINGLIEGHTMALRGCEDTDGNRYFMDAWWVRHAEMIQRLCRLGLDMNGKTLTVTEDGSVSYANTVERKYLDRWAEATR